MGFPRSIMRMPSGNEKLPDSELAMKLQEWSLPMIMGLDDIFRAEEGTTVMWFERAGHGGKEWQTQIHQPKLPSG